MFISASRRASSVPRLATAVLWLTTLCGLARTAKADPIDDLIEEGVRLRAQGRPAAALELFSRAHAIAPSARTAAQMGLAEAALYHWLDAESHISDALDSHDSSWIANHRNREALEQALVAIRKHIGGVAVAGPKGALITINGKPAGTLPLDRPVRVEEGTARVEGSADGYSSASVEVPVSGGRDTTAVLEMLPLPTAAVAPPVPLVLAAPQDGSRWKTWTGISILGLSVASVATGIAWVVLDGRPACGAPSGTLCQRVYNTAPLGWVAIGVGVAGGVGGGLLIWSGRRSNAAVDVGLGSVGFHGRF
jgi:hypothetical protein